MPAVIYDNTFPLSGSGGDATVHVQVDWPSPAATPTYVWTYTVRNVNIGSNNPQDYINSDSQTSFWLNADIAVADARSEFVLLSKPSNWGSWGSNNDGGLFAGAAGDTTIYFGLYAGVNLNAPNLGHGESATFSFTTLPLPIVPQSATFGDDTFGEAAGEIVGPGSGIDEFESEPLSTEYPDPEFSPDGEYSAPVADGNQDKGLYINGVKVTTTSAVYEKFKADAVRKEILDAMMGADFKSIYPNQEALENGMTLRVAIVEAAKKGAEVKLKFTDRHLAKATDSDFWQLDGKHPAVEGGIELKPDKKPSQAIDDIFANPDKYAFDCATMQMVIVHKALRDYIGNAYDAKIKSVKLNGFNVDGDLRVRGEGLPLRPGDRVTFNNPDAQRSSWLFENTIYLGDGKYFAPGMGAQGAPGVLTEAQVINKLNDLRRVGATTAASRSTAYGLVLYPDPSKR